jgi:hypothetical protein
LSGSDEIENFGELGLQFFCHDSETSSIAERRSTAARYCCMGFLYDANN